MRSLSPNYKLLILNLLFAVLLLAIALPACKKGPSASDHKEYRSIAWNYLNEKAISNSISDWENAEVRFEDYEGQSTAVVKFTAKMDPLYGPTIIYISTEEKNVVGIK